MFALALVLSISGLLIGPAVTTWARGRSRAVRVVDVALRLVVLPLLLLRLLPHLVSELGSIAVAAAALGYAAMWLIDLRSHHHAARVGAAIVVPALAVHSLLDGAALAVAFSGDTGAPAAATIGLALVLHRIPEGFAVAAALGRTHPPRRVLVWVAALALATVLGGLVGRALLVQVSDLALHAVVAVGLGVMVRLIMHHHHVRDPAR